MATRIAGINLPNKRIVIALTYIYGIGLASASKILKEARVDQNKKANTLSPEQVNKIRKIMEKSYVIEGDLKAKVHSFIKRLISINCYRGMRHRSGLPVRGQRTQTNGRTRKGKGKTIANKKMIKK